MLLFTPQYTIFCKEMLRLFLKIILIFRCERGSYTVLETMNATSSELVSSTKHEEHLMQYLQDPTFIILSVCLLVMIVIVVVLSVMVFRLRRRPRIKKRIIVNKNVTPLTYRPQSTEQCEITIENCCNMNVCETVSFKKIAYILYCCNVREALVIAKFILNVISLYLPYC